MKARLLVLATLLLTIPASQSYGQFSATVTEMFHVDPGWEAGGYWELTVTNHTGEDVYLVAVGKTDVDLVVVRYPDLTGLWRPERINEEGWDSGEITFPATGWTPPVTTDYPFDTYFPGSTDVLVYYVIGTASPIANGGTQDGFYFNYAIPHVIDAPNRVITAVGSPFLVFDGAGELVAQGETTGPPLGTESTTWGAVKALYRR